MTWHAVDAGGTALAGDRPTPAAALSATPVPVWPLSVAPHHPFGCSNPLIGGVLQPNRGVTFAAAVGPGGERVSALLDALTAGAGTGADAGDVEALARQTPAGTVGLPIARVGLAAGVEAAAGVDPAWLADVERRRAELRDEVVAAGRGAELEAALHVALLLATDRLDPADDADVDAHVASGARLWLIAGAVVSALSGATPGPFAAWGRLVAAGWWPVGPSGGRLVVSEAT